MSTSTFRGASLAAALVLGAAATAGAQSIVTFEVGSVPGLGLWAQGVQITTQYQASHGVTFALENGGSPRLARVGAPLFSFDGPAGAPDTPVANSGVGAFFLTGRGLPTTAMPETLLVTFDSAVSAVSGLLLDVDDCEQWTVEALDNGVTIDVVNIAGGFGGAADGTAVPFSFQRQTPDITGLRFEFTGQLCLGDTQATLALDNLTIGKATPSFWDDVGDGFEGIDGVPDLKGGGALLPGEFVSLDLGDAAANSTAWVAVGFEEQAAPFKGGTLYPSLAPPGFLVNVVTDGTGGVDLGTAWPAGVPLGAEFFFQVIVDDPAAANGFALSNAVVATAY